MGELDTFTAVLAANILTVMFVYSLVMITRDEKSGREPRIYWVLGMLVPVFVMLVGLYQAGWFSATPLRHVTEQQPVQTERLQPNQ